MVLLSRDSIYRGLVGHMFCRYGLVGGGLGESVRLFYRSLSRTWFSFWMYRSCLTYILRIRACGGGISRVSSSLLKVFFTYMVLLSDTSGYSGRFGHTFCGCGHVWGGTRESIRLFHMCISHTWFSFWILRSFLTHILLIQTCVGGGMCRGNSTSF